MKLPHAFKPELLVEAEAGRYRTDCMLFVRECAPLGGKAALVATNRRALIVLPVETEKDDVDGLVSIAAMRCAREREAHPSLVGLFHVHMRLLEKEIQVVNRGTLVATFPRPEGEFPRYEGVIPEPKDGAPTVSLSVQYLRDLADAAGENHVAVTLEGGKDAPHRVFQTHTGAIGVLMPITPEPE